MDESSAPASSNQTQDAHEDQPEHLRPTGLSALELGARRGIGPLSPAAAENWHGDATPCVSCGQLVRRAEETCASCGQDLSPKMLARMRLHAGPWYVLEHVRPFPGVALDRLLLQIKRGVLTRTTIVRGPSTGHQWKFAAETPGLSKHLGCCWSCHRDVQATDTHCPACQAYLDAGVESGAKPPAPPASDESAELVQLTAALRVAPAPAAADSDGARRPGRRAPVPWIVGVFLVVTLVAVFALVKIRSPAAAGEKARAEPAKTASPVPLPVPEPAPIDETDSGEPSEPAS